jgi:hypothetical protein
LTDGADPGCAGGGDVSERNPLQPCDDGIDNDGDFGVDVAGDPGCLNPTWPLENPKCQNGIDDDGDGGIDFDGGVSALGVEAGASDPHCAGAPHRDYETQNPPASTCGLGAELALAGTPLLVLWARRRR